MEQKPMILIENKSYDDTFKPKHNNLNINIHNYIKLVCVCVCVCVQLLQLCLTLCDPVDCNSPGSSVHGILQARILEWVAMPSSMGSS